MARKKKKKSWHKLKNRLAKSYRRMVSREATNQIIHMSRGDIASETLNIQPPKLNQKLFKSGDVADAMIGRGMWLNQQSYQDGYIGTAITLLDLIKLSDNNKVKDSYIIVALFCFRQYLELSMKDSLIHYYKDEKLGELVSESGHNLVDLFNKIMELPQMESNETTEAVKQMINTIQGYDPTGVVFRYPYSIDKATGQIKSSLKPNIGLKSVKELRKRMLQLFKFFDGINSMAHDYERKRTAQQIATPHPQGENP